MIFLCTCVVFMRSAPARPPGSPAVLISEESRGVSAACYSIRIEFIFLFLPVTLLVYFGLNRIRLTVASNAWLLFASLVFYSWWNVKYLPLILASILFNYTIGYLLVEHGSLRKQPVSKKGDLHLRPGRQPGLSGLLQIHGLLHRQRQRAVQHQPASVADRPAAGDQLLHHHPDRLPGGLLRRSGGGPQAVELLPVRHLLPAPAGRPDPASQGDDAAVRLGAQQGAQLPQPFASACSSSSSACSRRSSSPTNFPRRVKAGFDTGASLNMVEAWVASLSYTFQLYFDFSGYSDMAIGVGLMFNIVLPVNFNSPYKAVNIIDFWKRWHMTLSNFITTYLYAPILSIVQHHHLRQVAGRHFRGHVHRRSLAWRRLDLHPVGGLAWRGAGGQPPLEAPPAADAPVCWAGC